MEVCRLAGGGSLHYFAYRDHTEKMDKEKADGSKKFGRPAPSRPAVDLFLNFKKESCFYFYYFLFLHLFFTLLLFRQLLLATTPSRIVVLSIKLVPAGGSYLFG